MLTEALAVVGAFWLIKIALTALIDRVPGDD